MRRLVLEVDRLVLRGFERVDAATLSNALHGELRALLSRHDVISPLLARHDAAVSGPASLRIRLEADPSSVGRALAACIVEGVQQPSRSLAPRPYGRQGARATRTPSDATDGASSSAVAARQLYQEGSHGSMWKGAR